MARDFEDLNELDDLSDGELRGVVLEHLARHEGLDVDDLTVRVEQGTVILEGRVGTEGESAIAEHLVTDLVGADACRNDIFVDPIRRAESPEAIDDHLVDEEDHEGLLLGDREVPLTAESEHLAKEHDDDYEGTSEVQKAIGDAAPWIPPEASTQEGLGEIGDMDIES